VEDDETEGGVMNRRRSIMKKLLVLMLVLGMASMANATIMNLTLYSADDYTLVAPGTVITVTLTTDQTVKSFGDSSTSGFDMTASGTNTATIGSGGWQVGNLGASDDGTEAGGDIIGAYMLVEMGYEYAAGTILYSFSATINEDGHIGMANVACQDPVGGMPPPWYTIGTITGLDVTVPEPMTIALLGLGGLFLRRRR